MKLVDYPAVARLVPEKKDGLLPCPFCGDEVLVLIKNNKTKFYCCSNIKCALNSVEMTYGDWYNQAIDPLTPLLSLEVGINEERALNVSRQFFRGDGFIKLTEDEAKEIIHAIASSNVIEIKHGK